MKKKVKSQKVKVKKAPAKKPAKKSAKKATAKNAKAGKVKSQKAKVKKASAKKPAKKAVKKAVKKSAKKAQAKKVIAKKITKKAVKKVVKKTMKVAKGKTAKAIKKVVTKTVKKVVSKAKAVVETTAAETFKPYQSSLKAGDRAPYFEGIDQNGNTINLSQMAGKKVILYFYPKDDTPGCTATACSLRDEYQFLGEKNYAVVGVSADDQKSHAKFAEKFDLPFPLIADTDKTIINAYDVWGTKMLFGNIYDGIIRTTFIISEDGILEQVIHEVNTESHAQQILGL